MIDIIDDVTLSDKIRYFGKNWNFGIIFYSNAITDAAPFNMLFSKSIF